MARNWRLPSGETGDREADDGVQAATAKMQRMTLHIGTPKQLIEDPWAAADQRGAPEKCGEMTFAMLNTLENRYERCKLQPGDRVGAGLSLIHI